MTSHCEKNIKSWNAYFIRICIFLYHNTSETFSICDYYNRSSQKVSPSYDNM